MPPDWPRLALSIVVPLKDEAPSVHPFHDEVRAVLDAADPVPDWEIIFVDDGSTDETWARVVEVHAADARVRAIRFTRNFGQTAAIAAGFAAARGHYIASCDGDLQNDPADIPRMLHIAADHDIVCGWRRRRRDDFLTRSLPSMAANWLIGLVSGVRLHDHGCSLKLFRAEVVRPLRLRPGLHRYLPALASRLGGRIAEVEVRHRPRRYGHSKYGLSRTFRVLADLARLRPLMRQAVDRRTPMPRLYDVATVLEAPARETAGCGTP
jgi:glycosyltransferase involved in cell wall biosynthesis